MVFDVFIFLFVAVIILHASAKFVLAYEKRKRKEFFQRVNQRKCYIGTDYDIARLRNWGDVNEK